MFTRFFSTCLWLAIAASSNAAFAQAPCHAENDGPGYSNNVGMSGAMVAVRFTTAAAAIIDRAEIFTGESGLNHFLAVWSHDGASGLPLAPLSSGAFTVQPQNSWQGAALAPVALSAGTTYWFVMTPPAGAQASIDTSNPAPGQPYASSTNGGTSWLGPNQFNGFHWKFRLLGSCFTAPVTYCTSGVSSLGCVPALSATACPSLSGAQQCSLSIVGAQGQTPGILFYGLSSLIQPWCSSGGTSFLCVKLPTQRTVPLLSGGTSGACDGSLSFDWDLYQASNPGALGQPWTTGQSFHVQGWYRDPPACRTTQLTNAVELSYDP